MADQQQPAQAPISQAPVSPAVPGVQSVSGTAPDYDEKFFAALGYFGPLFVLTFIAKPKSAYCKFHAVQSLVLFGFFVVSLVLLTISRFLGSLLTMALFAVYVLAIYRAYKGDMWRVPFISKFTSKVNPQAMYEKAGLAVSNLSGMKEAASGLAEKASSVMEKVTNQQETSESENKISDTPPPAAPTK